jgi:hypothetical protein
MIYISTGWSVGPGHDYQQFLPITPFLPPEKVSQNYLHYRPAASPWRVVPPQPSWGEVVRYRQKLDSIRDMELEMQPKVGSSKGGSSESQSYDPNLFSQPLISIPLFDLSGPRSQGHTETYTTPWFSIPNTQIAPQTDKPSAYANPNQTFAPWLNNFGGSLNPPQEQGFDSSSTPNTATPLPYVREPIMGGSSDVYIPYSFKPPTPAPAPGSAVIYSQPDAQTGK